MWLYKTHIVVLGDFLQIILNILLRHSMSSANGEEFIFLSFRSVCLLFLFLMSLHCLWHLTLFVILKCERIQSFIIKYDRSLSNQGNSVLFLIHRKFSWWVSAENNFSVSVDNDHLIFNSICMVDYSDTFLCNNLIEL